MIIYVSAGSLPLLYNIVRDMENIQYSVFGYAIVQLKFLLGDRNNEKGKLS
jgi:hypothetical protein